MIEVNISSGVDNVVQGSPYVIHNTYVTLERGGKVVGTIKARFDFSDCPPEHHSLAFQMLPNGCCVQMPINREEREWEARSTRPWWKFW